MGDSSHRDATSMQARSRLRYESWVDADGSRMDVDARRGQQCALAERIDSLRRVVEIEARQIKAGERSFGVSPLACRSLFAHDEILSGSVPRTTVTGIVERL